jgi:hypothetical protein
MINRQSLTRGAYYIGTCRNTNIAQWNGSEFIFINYEFSRPYVETINYYGDVSDTNADGFIPIYKINYDLDEFKDAKIKEDYHNFYRNIYKKLDTKCLSGEEWRFVVGYDGTYSVSNLGRVKNNKTNKIMKQNFSREYLVLGLTQNGRKKTERVHRLVLFAFKADSYNIGKEANHINNIKTDNRALNLEWVTHGENSRKMYTNDHYNKKLKSADVLAIKKLLKEGILSGIEIANKFNISTGIISEINTGKKWIDISCK